MGFLFEKLKSSFSNVYFHIVKSTNHVFIKKSSFLGFSPAGHPLRISKAKAKFYKDLTQLLMFLILDYLIPPMTLNICMEQFEDTHLNSTSFSSYSVYLHARHFHDATSRTATLNSLPAIPECSPSDHQHYHRN